jgi:integrase
MPRLSQSVPKYRKHRASGQAVVTLNGRDHYLGPHGTKASRLEYDRLIGEWLANGRNSPRAPAQALCVVELIARYWKFASSYYCQNGRDTKVLPGIKCALRYLLIHYETTPAAEFGPLALKAVRQRMVDDGHCRRYINDHVDRIRRMFKWAVAEQVLPVETYQALATVAGLRRGRTEARESEPVVPVEDAIVEATLPFLPEVVADMVRLQRLAGMRPAEVCMIRPIDIDRSNSPWEYTPQHHKTEHVGRKRKVFFGPQAQGVLLKYLARAITDYCFRPSDSEAKRRAAQHEKRRTPMSCGNRPGTNRKHQPKRWAGDCYLVDSYRRAIHRACAKAFPAPKGIENDPAKLKAWHDEHGWSPKQLRHAAATKIRRQFGLEAAQVVLGHSQANVTELYAQRDLALAARVAQQVG